MPTRIQRPTRLVLAGIVSLAAMEQGWGQNTGFQQELRPVLEQHCFKCHDEKKKKGGVDLARFRDEHAVLVEYKLWRRVLEQLATDQMPPDDETHFTHENGAQLAKGIQQTLARLDSNDPAMFDPGPSIPRRLSRLEYNHVIRDLTYLDFDVAEAVGFPKDTTGSSYDNIAAALGLSPALMEKYFTAADTVLSRLCGDPAQTAEERAEAEKRLDGKSKVARGKFFNGLSEQPQRSDVEAFVSAFARRAWRRPVVADDTAQLMRFYDSAVTKGQPPRLALRAALKPVLVAPEFLFRIEGDGTTSTGNKAVMRVSDLDLASRLSFFLWASIPDEALLAAAESGQLSKPDVLAAQVRRMLADPKAKALTESMLLRWLGADKVLQARPTTEFFPAFNDQLKHAMLDEARSFCDNLRTEDRPVFDLLDADYTFVNADLAKAYGLGGVTGKDAQRVTLKPEDHRGGILGMGAILASTSHTFRTSPTQRGRWVLDVVFGTPPPPPPANAGMFKDEKKEKEPKDFREKLAQHASDVACAGCHHKMDPLGFGLDNYDAIGQWRPTTADLNTKGELPTGERFDGAADLKKVLWSRRDEFQRNLIGQTLTFALGRDLQYFDEGQITRIKASMAQNGNTFSSLILGIVNSYPFQNRRTEEPPALAEAATPH